NATGQRVNYTSVIRISAYGGLVFALLYALSGGVAVLTGEFRYALLFLVTGSIVGAIGGMTLLLGERPERRSRPIDGLAVAIIFWLLAPITLSAPFYPLFVDNDYGLLLSVYEAVSNLTTTGHSLVPASVTLPASVIFWRAALHLFGAVAFLTMAMTVFAALNLGGPGIHRTRFFTIPDGHFFDATKRSLRLIALFVFAGTASICFLLLVGGIAPRDALAISASVITTGLVDPDLAIQPVPGLSGLLAAVVVFGLCLGTLGVIFADALSRFDLRSALFDAETISFAFLFVIAALFAFMAGLPLLQSAGWSLSSLSTSGLQLVDPERSNRIPLVLSLFPVLIGGAALSTAGGIKLSRMILLGRRVSGEFQQLGFRQSVHNFSFRGLTQTEETLIGVWVYLVGYIMACAIGILVFSIFDQSFDSSILITIGAIANAGHLLQGQFTAETPAVVGFAMTGMILGRLEVIALLPALNPYFWRN
ncbi:MAG: potassium transporter TrkG, partial [Pseudomonadota bacterium]